MGAGKEKIRPGVILFLVIMFLIAVALWVEILMGIEGIITASTLLLAVAVFVIMRLLNAKNIRSAEDERQRKIDAYARGHAWSISMLLVIVVFILGMFNIIEINGFLMVFAMFVVMGWSWIFFRAYYYFKGDVE
jgi:hypothetical protein